MISKKGFELSINFLVVLIMTVVTFAGGLVLARNMFSGADGISAKLTMQQQKDIESLMLNNDELVALPVNKKTIERGKAVMVGLGINNIIPGEEISDTFKVSVDFSVSEIENCKKGDISACPIDPNNFIVLLADTYDIEKNDHKVVEIPVMIPKDAKKTTYVYNVNVSYNSAGSYLSYDTIKKIYITVE